MESLPLGSGAALGGLAETRFALGGAAPDTSQDAASEQARHAARRAPRHPSELLRMRIAAKTLVSRVKDTQGIRKRTYSGCDVGCNDNLDRRRVTTVATTDPNGSPKDPTGGAATTPPSPSPSPAPTPPPTPGPGPGATPVPAVGVVVIGLVLLLLFCVVMCGLVAFWPAASSSPSATPISLGFTSVADQDGQIRIFLFVAMAGALGGLVHSLRSFYWYAGNRNVLWSWLPMYMMLPFVGAALGVALYLGLRGGLLLQPSAGAGGAGATGVNPYGFAGFALLAGLFTEQAIQKLKDVFTTLLTAAPKGTDHVEPKPPPASADQGQPK